MHGGHIIVDGKQRNSSIKFLCAIVIAALEACHYLQKVLLHLAISYVHYWQTEINSSSVQSQGVFIPNSYYHNFKCCLPKAWSKRHEYYDILNLSICLVA